MTHTAQDVTVTLTEREAALVAALVEHHRADMVSGFVEGTVTWTTQLTVDPGLVSDVLGTVNAWLDACRAITQKITRAQTGRGQHAAGNVPAAQHERGTGNADTDQ